MQDMQQCPSDVCRAASSGALAVLGLSLHEYRRDVWWVEPIHSNALLLATLIASHAVPIPNLRLWTRWRSNRDKLVDVRNHRQPDNSRRCHQGASHTSTKGRSSPRQGAEMSTPAVPALTESDQDDHVADMPVRSGGGPAAGQHSITQRWIRPQTALAEVIVWGLDGNTRRIPGRIVRQSRLIWLLQLRTIASSDTVEAN